jgi:indolepyruvate ferredoxin oxidoreductase
MTLWMGKVYGDVAGYTQMGGEGAQWVGLAPFTDTAHFYQNLGDGTFAHSGSLAIRFAVASGTNITYKLLYNSAVAMTGGQAITGGRSVAEIVAGLEAEGVKRIIVTTDQPERYAGIALRPLAQIRHRDKLVEAERELAAVPGVTVLINDQQCAAEKRRLRKRGKQPRPPASVMINQRVCEGCGDCGAKSNCLSVEPVATEFGRKTRIHNSSCNQDYSCLLGDCPSFMTVVGAATADAAAPRRRAAPKLEEVLPEPAPRVPVDRFSVYMMGIGGTGVVTVNQILGTAAALAGRSVRTIDDTGSSQKAGPVVSHLQVATAAQDGANRIGARGADLYLAFDLLVAAEPKHLLAATPQRTMVVAAIGSVPTGEMIADAHKSYPTLESLRAGIDPWVRRDEAIYLDAQSLAERLFGDHLASNMILVGAAYQAGALPIPAAAIERAITLNGAAVEMNIQAFRWGRMAVLAPERLAASPASDDVAPAPVPSVAARAIIDSVGATGELRRLLDIRVPDLVAYQDARLARRYAAFVAGVRRAVGEDGGIAVAVARNLYKLMAYKDEYEVARLLLDPAMERERSAAFGARAKVTYHLMPTFLRALGVTRKVKLGGWFRPVLSALRVLKPLRQTPIDPFGATRVRRVERALVEQYMAMIDRALPRLTPQNRAHVLALAELPDQVRGYEDVKLGNVGRYLGEARRLMGLLGLPLDLPDVLAAVPEAASGAVEAELAA